MQVISTQRFLFRSKYPLILVYHVLKFSNKFSLFSFLSLWFFPFFTSLYVVVCVSLCVVVLFFADCCQAKDQYIEQFKDTLNTSVSSSIAGFFAEPIQVGIWTLDINWARFYMKRELIFIILENSEIIKCPLFCHSPNLIHFLGLLKKE